MLSSEWIALLFILGATWVLIRALRRKAPAEQSKGPQQRAPGSPVYAPPVAATPVPVTGMRVMQMRTHGFLAIEGPDGRREEALPGSPLGAGEFPMGLWVAPDHTVFAVGKQYTGQPGPDDGVVWRRDPDGTWTTAHRLRGRVFGAVAGTGTDDVVVGTMGGIVWFDGSRWRETTLPYAMMWKVWLADGEVVAQAFDGSVAFTVTRGVATARVPAREPDGDRYTRLVDGTTYRVFDRSEEVGERTLEPAEEREIRGELQELGQILARERAN